MALTLEQIEGRLLILEGENRGLKEATRRLVSPFEDIATQLSLESGHTVSARTRRMPMTTHGFPQTAFSAYPDAASNNGLWGINVPSDWVVGTDITVNVFLTQTATGGGPTVVLASSIGVSKEGDTASLTNIESAASANTTLTQNIATLVSRTVTGTSVEVGDSIACKLTRVGADGGDTVNDVVRVDWGAWIEYTAFF